MMVSSCENSGRILNLEERFIELSSRLERIDVNTEHLIQTNDRLTGIMEGLDKSINKLDVTLVKVISAQEHDRENMFSLEEKIEREIDSLKQKLSKVEEQSKVNDDKFKFDIALWLKKNFLSLVVVGYLILDKLGIAIP